MEALKELEEILKEQSNFQDAVNEFANFGGSDTYNFVKRVLRSLLTDDVSIQYSWLERKNKEAFANLRLASAVIYAAEKAKVADTKKKCEDVIMSWLKRASDRQLAAAKKN